MTTINDHRPLLGFDTETFLIDHTAQLPKIICLSQCFSPAEEGSGFHTSLTANATPDELRAEIVGIITDRTILKVNQAIAFDLGVFAANYPDLLPAIFDALDAEQFSCIQIREKLLNLTRTGDLGFLTLPDGSKSPIKYNLEALAKNYLGVDLSEDKSASDAWRMNYSIFDGIPLDQWPTGAKTYPIDDAAHPVKIWHLQELARNKMLAERGIDPFATESFRVMVDFCLKLMASHGVATDPEAVAKVEAMLAKELSPEKMNLIIEAGILRPGTPPKAKKGRVDTCPTCKGTGTDPNDAAPDSDPNHLDCPQCKGEKFVPQTTKGTEESVDTKKLKAHVEAFARKHNTDPCPACNGSGQVHMTGGTVNQFVACKTCGAKGVVPKVGEEPAVVVKFTPPSEKFPDGQLSVTSDWLNEYAHMDPLLAQYKHRQDLQKLVTTEIPRMKLNGVVAPVVYPQFDCLKETGRTSSFGYKPTAAKPALSATFNCQNVDPRVKNCYVPRPGMLLWSCDYSQMELGTLAQTCYRLFGHSVLRDKINAGVDVHGYTGAQLAYALDDDFRKLCIAIHGTPSPEQIAAVFLDLKKEPEGSEEFKFWKHWRKFAKPVNLGYPGGLGPKTFVTYAASEQYGVHVTKDEAETLRDLWKQTYPEMVDYFRYINNMCIDPYNKGFDEDAKEEYALYNYDSPFGLHRAGCDYCACANGLGLQTPSADGALTSIISVMRACYTGHRSTILAPVQGKRVCQPTMFVHDELIGEVVDDEHAHERLMEVKRLMIEAMRLVTPDVAVNANPCLMRRWDKAAEGVYDSDGRLTVWTPAKK